MSQDGQRGDGATAQIGYPTCPPVCCNITRLTGSGDDGGRGGSVQLGELHQSTVGDQDQEEEGGA